jgi:hypothetical protein
MRFTDAIRRAVPALLLPEVPAVHVKRARTWSTHVERART